MSDNAPVGHACRVAELEKIVFDRTIDIELVKEEVNHAEVLVL